jgi:23S rRNA pseudouridine1911/1915/1917 synthase
MEITVETDPGTRLDAFLAERLDGVSRSRIQQLIREGFIVVNDGPAKPRDAVRAGDHIRIALPEAVPDVALPEHIPLQVLHEDDDLLVIDKASGLVVHPGPGNPSGTLVNALLHHCQGRLSGIGGVERPGIVHRLDKDTSGCIVVAKTDAAHQSLAAQFAERSTMEKLYLAVLRGIPSPERDSVFTHIGRHPVNRQKMAVVNPPGGKPALTDYEILHREPASRTCLVLCHLHTGRTHQIRVHMHHKGCPIVADPLYGRPAPPAEALPERLMLHAWRLSFLHPSRQVTMRFEAPIPAEFLRWTEAAPLPP